MFNSIKSFRAIQKAPIQNAAIPQILINRFINKPGTERSVAELLEAKLKVTALKKMTIVQDYDPIQKLEDQRADGYNSLSYFRWDNLLIH